MPNPGFYASSYGNVRLWISRLSTRGGRQLVVHEASAGNEHIVQDRGDEVVVTSATLLFDYMAGDTLGPLERMQQLRALRDGKPHVLTHPTRGSFRALIGPFTEEIDSNGTITAEVEFTAADALDSVIPAGSSSIPASGEGLVDAAAEALSAELAELEIVDAGIASSAMTSASTWTASEDLNPREVLAETGQYTDQLGQQAESLQSDLDHWEAFKRTVLLADAVRTAAESVTSDTAMSTIFRVGAPTALRTLLASEYGAEQADYYFQQVMRLNDIATPGLIEEGTMLQLPRLPGAERNG